MRKTRRKKQKEQRVAIRVIACACSVLLLLIFFANYFSYEGGTVNYTVSSCEREGEKPFSVTYDERNKILNAEVWVNCCGVEIKVEKEDSTYKIFEKQYGELCRCACKRRVRIFDVPEQARVEFLSRDGGYFILSPNLKFCGWSTYGKCSSDKDCITTGCSKQICQSRFEKPMLTTCEWKDCYDTEKFGIACRCVEGRCQWVKE